MTTGLRTSAILKRQAANFPKRKRGETANESGFAAWRGFVAQLAYFEVPTERERLRLQKEMNLIERADLSEIFWFLYTTFRAMKVNGGGYVQGGATNFFVLHFLSVTRENPLEKNFSVFFLKDGFPKITFAVPKGKRKWLLKYLLATYGAKSLSLILGKSGVYAFSSVLDGKPISEWAAKKKNSLLLEIVEIA
ncbi:MAG: hypothetical protein IJB97_04260 [Clostridia bacterium]|nr:hypothetical protein [Clostridia bacterium]